MAYGVDMAYISIKRAKASAIERWLRGSMEFPLGFLFRVDSTSYSVSDEYGDHAYSRTAMELEAFPISKRTPKGWRLLGGRWVGEEHRKQYAHPTVEGALESFMARKKRQAEILEARAKVARYLHDQAKIKLEGELQCPIAIE